MKILTTLALLMMVLLSLSGCYGPDDAIEDLEKRPINNADDAKKLVSDIEDLISLHEQADVEDLSEEQLKKLEALLETRKEEAQERFGLNLDGFNGAIGGVVDWAKSVDWKGKAKEFVGKDTPKATKYKGPVVDPKKDGGSKDWP
ncbi:hypothetical protein HYW73_02670 [Candidatus Nomurabacteria bacterium]|nr:hypothetical protein [Candidatus Nomurabacteria bacterium]